MFRYLDPAAPISSSQMESAFWCLFRYSKKEKVGDSRRKGWRDFALSGFYAITVPPHVVSDEGKAPMPTVQSLLPTKIAQRVAAVLDLFRGLPLPQITAQHGICRSDLYKFRRRALTALH